MKIPEKIPDKNPPPKARRYRITDKKRINKVKEKLVLQQMVNVPGITVINGNMDIQVNYENKNGGNSIYCYSICTDDEMQQLLKE